MNSVMNSSSEFEYHVMCSIYFLVVFFLVFLVMVLWMCYSWMCRKLEIVSGKGAGHVDDDGGRAINYGLKLPKR